MLEFTKTINWQDGENRINLDDRALYNIRYVGHPKFVTILLDIVRILSKNKYFAQDFWDFLYPEFGWKYIKIGRLEMLRVCAEMGALPSKWQMENIQQWSTDIILGDKRRAICFFQILLAFNSFSNNSCNKLQLEPNLNFLVDFYAVPINILHLGRELMQSHFKTWEECKESKKLINCFLYVTNEQQVLTEEFIQSA